MSSCGIQILKVTYKSCLGKVFENLTKKIQSFPGFKNFGRFRVFVLSYRANSKTWKRRKIANLVESKAILLQCVFWNCWLYFFVWKCFFRYVLYYFPAYPGFPALPSNRPGPFKSVPPEKKFRKVLKKDPVTKKCSSEFAIFGSAKLWTFVRANISVLKVIEFSSPNAYPEQLMTIYRCFWI